MKTYYILIVTLSVHVNTITAGGPTTTGIDDTINTYGRGVGRIPDKRPCPPGTRDDGTSCWSDAHVHGKGCCCTVFTKWCCDGKGHYPCGAGYHDDGCTCRKTDVGIKMNLFERHYCHEDEDLYAALCYPKCQPGFVAVGCCVCSRTVLL